MCLRLTYYNRTLWFLRLGNNKSVDRNDRMLIGKVLRQNREAWVKRARVQTRPSSRAMQSTPDSLSTSEGACALCMCPRS